MKKKNKKDLKLVSVKIVDVDLSTKETSLTNFTHQRSTEELNAYRSHFLIENSENKLTNSSLMGSYTTKVDNLNTQPKNRQSHSIGTAFRSMNLFSTALGMKQAKPETINIRNIRKMNCRNGRTKFQETLIGGMVRPSYPLSRPSSEYQGLCTDIKHPAQFLRMSLISPSLSVYRSEMSENQFDEFPSGEISNFKYENKDNNSKNFGSTKGDFPFENAKDDINCSNESQANDSSIELEQESITKSVQNYKERICNL